MRLLRCVRMTASVADRPRRQNRKRAANAAAAGAADGAAADGAASSPPADRVPPTLDDLNVAVRPESYAEELAAKVAGVRAVFATAAVPLPAHIDVYESERAHFRQRAEFTVWHKADRSYYAMFAKGSKFPVEVPSFPFGSTEIGRLMPAILDGCLAADATLRKSLFQARFLTTRSGQALVSLIYRAALDETAWLRAAEALRAQLGLVGLVGRAKGQKLVAGVDYVEEALEVGGQRLLYRQVEDTFSQSNAGIAEHMLRWALRVARSDEGADPPPPGPRGDDLLELYCGSGNFTVALAPAFRRVFATELSKQAVHTAEHNLAANGRANVQLGRVSAEELREAMAGVRPFERLRHVDLASLQFSTVFVDPPRAGCGPEVAPFLASFDRIVYISCNPATMAEDIARLPSHEVVRFAVFDQFPYTHHLESGCLLLRKKAP